MKNSLCISYPDAGTCAITIATALQHASQLLGKTSPSPQLESEVLLAHACGRDRTWLRARPEHLLDDVTRTQFAEFIARRASGEPIAYITGRREFWSLELQVSPATLIPRPETELLVEQALVRIPRNAKWQIADLGTGSGAIALAIAHERPRCHIIATDLSQDALAVAKGNAQRLGIHNIEFRHGDWCAALGTEAFEMIVSNPPYIAADDAHLQQGDLPFEPDTALTSGGDGLAALRNIIQQAPRNLHPEAWLLLEHGYDQRDSVAALFKAAGYREVIGYNDYGGQARVSAGQHT
ncbi:MAG: peptide chain release factor N(5)-glutamine methyltransferase [Gammaproteobacteria bacterium]|nr:peptide chain release factor N(5)-glutamine methyltransferase [Gammaproteobacteria bacterium]